jgi:hypothetical protein
LRVVAYEFCRTSATLHSDGLGLIPIDFCIRFDDFFAVGICRLAWRWRDDFGASLRDGLISLSVSRSTNHADLSSQNS